VQGTYMAGLNVADHAHVCLLARGSCSEIQITHCSWAHDCGSKAGKWACPAGMPSSSQNASL
jgi:hypothetical protein